MTAARPTRPLRWPAGAVVAALVGATTGCVPSGTDTAGVDAGSGHADGSITVFAAASLRASFTELAGQFEEAYPGAEVTLNVAGSSDLATQIIEGAPADVFASADTVTMARVVAADLTTEEPVDVATNTLQLVVPPDNPAGISSLADAARPGVKTVVCARQVPCGAVTAKVEEVTGVDLTPVSEESSVTDVLGKVTSGEADVGLVYVTDVRAAGDAVVGIGFPEADGPVTTYPIAALTGSDDAATARAFVEFAAGPFGLAVLGTAGFGAP